jgi:hypothetical protein
VDDPGELGLTPQQLPKIDDVEDEQRARPHRDDRGIAGTAGDQCHLAKEFPRPENHRFGLQLHFDLACRNKIHAVPW